MTTITTVLIQDIADKSLPESSHTNCHCYHCPPQYPGLLWLNASALFIFSFFNPQLLSSMFSLVYF